MSTDKDWLLAIAGQHRRLRCVWCVRSRVVWCDMVFGRDVVCEWVSKFGTGGSVSSLEVET
jgi:hypothetical protein